MQRKCIEQHKMYRTTTTKKQRKYEICPCNTKGIKVILSIKKKKKPSCHLSQTSCKTKKVEIFNK